jgi:hypothetical protein
MVLSTDEAETDKKPKAEATNNELLLACEAALLLRGIHAAILDPLALAGEKESYRSIYKEIEAQIRAAIDNAKRSL